MSHQALLLEAHHTTHFEGTQLTLDESRLACDGNVVDEANADDVRELLNDRSAFELVSEYLSSGMPITEILIRSIHGKLVGSVRGGDAKPGMYRLFQDYVVSGRTLKPVYMPPPPEAVPGLMQELMEWLRADSGIHPVLVAGIAQFELVHIHPFVDGKGRTSRLLSTLCLYRSGYDFKRLFTISEYYDRDRQAFYDAIQSVRNRGMDLTAWLEYFTNGLATQLDEVKLRGERVIKSEIVGTQHRLNARQRAIIEILAENNEITISALLTRMPGRTQRTLQRVLKVLLEKNLIAGCSGSSPDPNRAYRLAEL